MKMNDVSNRINEMLYEHKWYKRFTAITIVMSMLCAFFVPLDLIRPEVAVSDDSSEYELICDLEEHIHTEECYTLICSDDSEEHEHSEECYELTCGMDEHQHSDECYAEIEYGDFNSDDLKLASLETPDILADPGSSVFDGQKSSKKKPSTREDNNDNLINATGGNSYFTSPVSEVGPNTKEVEDSEIQNITVTIGGNDYSAPDQDGNGVTVLLNEMNQDPVDASFSIRYVIEKDGDNYPVNVDSPCIYYQLPDGVKIPDEYYGRTRYVSDPNYNGPDGHISGYFSINEDGLIVIQFTEDYIRNKIYQSDYFEGSINFDGQIHRAQTQSGDREIMIGGLTLQIPFSDQESQLNKTNNVALTESGVDINWTVEVINNANPAELSGCILDDPLFQNGDVTVDPSDAGSFVDGKFVFADAANYASKITFTYTESLDADEINSRMLADNNPYSQQFTLENNRATLLASDGTTELKHADSTAYSKKPIIEKSGEESYKHGKWIKSTIYWTIDVTAPEGGNLNGYYITDDALNQSLTQDNKLQTQGTVDSNGHKYSVVVMNGDTELTEGTGYTYDTTNGKITFNGDYENVSILYVTNCHDVPKDENNKRNVYNTVNLYHPDKDTPLGSKDAYVSFDNSTYRYSKSAAYDYDNNTIKWEISGNILNPSNSNIYLNNPEVQFYLKDASLKTIGLDKLTLKSANWKNEVYDFTLDSSHATDDPPYLLVKNGDNVYGKIQFKSGTDDTLEVVDYEENTPYHLSAIAFNYTIDVSGDDAKPANGESITKDGMTITANDDGSVITYSNALGNGLAGDDYKGIIGTYNKTVRSTIGKNITEVTGVNSELGRDTGWYYTDPENHNEPVFKKLSWKVDLIQDEGFEKDSVFTDTLKSSDSSVQHIYDESMLDLQITLKTKENGGTVISGEDVLYTVSIVDNKLTVTFDEDYSNYKYATITYNSKAMVSQIKGSDDEWASASNRFYNEAEYADHTASNGYSYQNKNPEYIEKFTLALNKVWADSDTTKRPDSIQFRLLRRSRSASLTDEEKKWKYLTYDAASENWVEHEEEDALTDDSLYLFSAYRTQNYAYSFANLPKDTTAHDGDYEYKIVELPVDAYSTSYQADYAGFSGSHSYQITNTRENSVEKYVLDADGNRVENGKLALDNIELVNLNQIHHYLPVVDNVFSYYTDGKEYPNYEELSAALGHDKDDSYHTNSDTISNEKQVTGEYYIIQYELAVDILDADNHTITDMIPEGSILIYDQTDTNNDYQPVLIESIESKMTVNGNSQYHGLFAGDLKQEIKFTQMANSVKGFRYYIGIPKEIMEQNTDGTVSVSMLLTNTAKIDNSTPVVNTVSVSKNKTDHEDNTLISKDVANMQVTEDGKTFYEATEQELRYRILVNPDAKKLAATNKSTYDIYDILKINPKTVGVDIVSVTAKEVNITSPLDVDAEGRYVIDSTKYEIVNGEEPITYSYVSGDDSVTESDVAGEYLFLKKENTNDHVDYFETERHVAIPEKEVVYLTIKGKIKDENKSGIDGTQSLVNIIYQQYIDWGAGNTQLNPLKTLNPTASSDYVKSYQYDPETGEYTMLVKLSDMPEKTSDIKIERSDYRGEGITSVTVESATRYKTNDQGELVITVPDSKALLIEYTYKVDVKSGEIIVTNEASIDTGNVSAWDKESGTEFEVSKAQAFSGAQNEVKLVKRDINDYNLKIDADFYVAYYDGDQQKWIFSSANTESTQGTGNFAYAINGFTFDLPADGNSIPNGAAKVTVNGIKHIILSKKNAVYKFIEVPTTPGYLGTDITFPVTYDGLTFNTFDELVNDYLTNEEARSEDRNYPFRSFFSTYVPVHYFSYGDGTITKPQDVDSDLIKNVSDGDNLNIDNTKLLSVKAEKNWNGGTWPNGATALLKLYYSEKKITDGTFPASLKEVSKETLSIQDSNFKATVSLNSGMQSYTWTNLPTSINDKRIYYYVREESYTIDGVNYRLQDDGSYTDGIEKGLYSPNYDGNGISRSDSDSSAVITVSNTSGLFLKKIWLDYYGGEIDGSSDELPESIQVELKGKNATTGAEEKLYIVGSNAVDANGVITLTAPGFMMELDGNITLRNQPNTSNLDAALAEKTAAFNAAKAAYEADSSDNAKKQAMDDAEAEMIAAQQAVNDVTVKVSGYSFFTLTERDSDQAICWDTSVNPVNENAKVSDVYRASSLSSVVNGKGQIAVANQKKNPTPISITANKEWVGGVPSGDPQIQLILYKTTDPTITADNFEQKLKNQAPESTITLPDDSKDGQSWSYTWTGLEKKDSVSKLDYHYFIKEVKTNLTGYLDPTYDNQGRTGGGSMTVYNTPVPKAQLEVIKQWTDKNSSKRPSKVYVDLYRIAETPVQPDPVIDNNQASEPAVQPSSFKSTKEKRNLNLSSVRRALSSATELDTLMLSKFSKITPLADATPATDSEGRTYYIDEIGSYYLFTIGQWGQWSCFDIPVLDENSGYTSIIVEGNVGNGKMFWGVPKYSWGGGQDTSNALVTLNTAAGTYDISNYPVDNSYNQLVFSPDAQITDVNGVNIKVYFGSSFELTPSLTTSFDVGVTGNAAIAGTVSKSGCEVVSSDSEFVEAIQDGNNIVLNVKKYKAGTINIIVSNGSDSAVLPITINPMQLSETNVSALATSTEPISISVTHTAGNSPIITGGDSSIASCVYNDGQLIITPTGTSTSPTAVSTTWNVSYGGVVIPVTFTANPTILTAEITDGKTKFNIGEEFHVRTNKPAGFHLQKSENNETVVDGLTMVGEPVQGGDGYYTYTFKVNGREDIDAAYLVAENTDNSNQNVGMPVSFKMVYTEKAVEAIDELSAAEQNTARIINNIPLEQDPNNPNRYICTDAATLAKLAELPTTDDDGNAYHYYIVEDTEAVTMNGYVPWDYSGNNGSTLKANGKVTYTVYNGRNEEDLSEATTLPEAGGSGASIYYITGALLMLLTAAGYTMFKRRRWLSE
jgi:hypothetical protein